MGESLASAAHPSNESCIFAVAASKGSFIILPTEDDWDTECIDAQRRPANAIDWHGENIVLRGSHDGAVRLWDMRTRAESLRARIQLHSTINHVRSINENFVVVAGLDNQVSNVPSPDAESN